MSLTGSTEVKNSLIGNIHLLKKVHGYSAYDLAVAHGFKGTEEEWLNSLKGKDGYTPVKNVDYFDGEKGDTGTIENHSGIDALNLPIVNVANPEGDGDAVNKKYVEDNYLPVDGSVPMKECIENFNYDTYAVVRKERLVGDVVYRANWGVGSKYNYGTISAEIFSSADGFASIINRIDITPDGEMYITRKGEDAKVFSERNKPTGTYTGNGSARTVLTGGTGTSNLLLIINETAPCTILIGKNGGFMFYNIDGEDQPTYNFASSSAKYENGVLTIKGSTNINAEGSVYKYQVL